MQFFPKFLLIPASLYVQASRARKESIFRNAAASLCATGRNWTSELGVGVALYFRFIKYIAICFLCMSILALPSLFISGSGNRIPSGSSSLALLTLGNIGTSALVCPPDSSDPCPNDKIELALLGMVAGTAVFVLCACAKQPHVNIARGARPGPQAASGNPRRQ